MRALTRVADPSSEADLIELARHATAAQLERMVRAARRVTAAAGRRAAARELPALVLGRRRRLPAPRREAAARGRGALPARARGGARRALRAPARRGRGADGGPRTVPRDRSAAIEPSGSAEPPPPPLSPWDSRRRHVGSPTNAESLAALSETRARPPADGPGRAAERYQLVVHVDAETLATDSPGAGMRTGPARARSPTGPGSHPRPRGDWPAMLASSRSSSATASR